ncbi:hypothetical protein M0805_004881, partial [Coniferiporia weirii]
MAPDDSNAGLTRTSSLVQDSTPTTSKSSVRVEHPTEGTRDANVVIYSEGNGKLRYGKLEVIELSDSDDDLAPSPIKKTTSVDDPFLSSPGKVVPALTAPTDAVIPDSESDFESDIQPFRAPRSKPKSPWSRRAVISDSEEEEEEIDDEVDVNYHDDAAVLVLNDPPSSRKPLPRSDVPSGKPKLKALTFTAPVIETTPSGGKVLTADPPSPFTPVIPRNSTPANRGLQSDYLTLASTSPTKGKARAKSKTKGTSGIDLRIDAALNITSVTVPLPETPAGAKPPVRKRMTKKALEEQKQAQLAAYAQTLFDDLNEAVFEDRLPKDTALLWNKKLQTTAGRAKWHVSSQKVETTSIELATKVLDCEERIRNTLSHEMCHLACWVINRNPKENHGGIWSGWARKVMQKRHDIVITTKHSYDIAYKFEWQCQTVTCKKIYGRHSKSIDPKNSICGVCKTGELLPLFQTRSRKTKADSNLAADKTR